MNKDFFVGNRRQLLAKTDAELVVLSANGLVQSDNYMTFPFKQESNFWYLTGINEPDIILVFNKNQEFLIVPERSAVREIFEGRLDLEAIKNTSGIKELLDEKTGWSKLKALVKQTGTVASLEPLPLYIKDLGQYTNPAPRRLISKLRAGHSSPKITDLQPILRELRMIKQPAEIEAIQKAVDITAQTFREVIALRQQFKYEHQIESAVVASFKNHRASGEAFPTIVAAGAKACTLHYAANNQRLKPGELVLLDAGAQFSHYASDLTRTFALSKPTKRQQAVFEAVLATQQLAFSKLRPGLKIKDYATAVMECEKEQLFKLGLISKTGQIEEVRKYCPHGVSHFLGINVHDPGDYQRPLAPGMVLTVEPGIYIPQEGIGIRVEDDVLITKSGHQVLSAGLPRTLW